MVNSIQLKVEIPWGERIFVMYGVVAMIPYYLGFAAFVLLAARTRGKAPLYLYLAAILCALAVLAKGLAGLGLPLIVFLAYLAFTRSWWRLGRAQMGYGLVVSVIAFAVVAVPWHHAMLIRHGLPFWNELFGDNHWRRMVIGRHGDRGSFEYFLRELGYGMWPWIVLAPAALGWAVLRRPATTTTTTGAEATAAAAEATATLAEATATPAEDRKQQLIWLGAIWFVSSYAVVSLSMTKFHHYVLPAIPGLAIVVGCFIDDLLAAPGPAYRCRGAAAGAAAAAADHSRSDRGQRGLGAVPLAVLVRLRAEPVGAPLAAVARFLGGADRLRRRLRRGDGAAGLAARAAHRPRGAAAGGDRLHLLSARRLHAQGGAVLVAEGADRHLLPARRSPDERLIAYMLYWRGETFYTSNEIYEGPTEERTVFDQEGADDRLKDWIAHHRGRRAFFIFEHHQQSHIAGDLPPEVRASFQIVDDSNNKFSLAQADL